MFQQGLDQQHYGRGEHADSKSKKRKAPNEIVPDAELPSLDWHVNRRVQTASRSRINDHSKITPAGVSTAMPPFGNAHRASHKRQ
jgi:hypothetical protein